jgi:hypothetical protein
MLGLDAKLVSQPRSISEGLVVNLGICIVAAFKDEEILVCCRGVLGMVFQIVEEGQVAVALAVVNSASRLEGRFEEEIVIPERGPGVEVGQCCGRSRSCDNKRN